MTMRSAVSALAAMSLLPWDVHFELFKIDVINR